MSEVKSVMDFAEKQGYESAYLVLKWDGYDVYQPVFSDEMSYIGLPLMILVKGEKIRMTTPDEAFEIFDIMNDVDDNNFVGDEYIVEDWDKEHLVERVKGMFHKWFSKEEYKDNYIEINGEKRPVYGSDGKRIAKTEKELREFYKWFGNSSVVDKLGRPIVLYHGSNEKFDKFPKKSLNEIRNNLWGVGFYFTNSEKRAELMSKKALVGGKKPYVYSVYLKINNPLVDGKIGKIGDEYDGRIQHGAGVTNQEDYYVVKEPEQIRIINRYSPEID